MHNLEYSELLPKSGDIKNLVILLHGYGSNGDDLISLTPEWSSALPHTLFISPNAPFSCEMSPFGYQWFSLNNWSDASMLQGVENASPILQNFIDEQLKKFRLSPNKLALVGFSQGTMMSLHLGLRQKQQIAGILGYSGAMVGKDRIQNEAISKPPICLIHGTVDPVVPFAAMEQAQEALEAIDIQVETHARPMLPHGIDPKGIEIGQKFLQRILS